MSVAYDDTSWCDYGNEEQVTYIEYLMDEAGKIPDKWLSRDKYYESEELHAIDFTGIPVRLKKYVKAFAYDNIYYAGNSHVSTSASVRNISNFCEFCAELLKQDSLTIHKLSTKKAFVRFLEKLYGSVREDAVPGNLDEESRPLSIRSATTLAYEILRFLRFLRSFSSRYAWVGKIELRDFLPINLEEYFEPYELKIFENEIEFAKIKNKKRALPYTTLYKLMEFLYSQEPSMVKTALVIAAHTGLRISEIRELRVDCLVPVTDEEASVAKEYVRLIGKESALGLNFKRSYWLRYAVLKGAGGNPKEGTPILVGQRVKDVVDEYVELRRSQRKEMCSNMLFVRERKIEGTYSVASTSAFYAAKREMVGKGMPHVKFHELRATFATVLADLGVPIEQIKKYMNHISADVTASYVSSQQERDGDIYRAIIEGEVADGNGDEVALRDFRDALRSAIGSQEFAGMSFSSQVNFFQRMKLNFGIEITISDHGVCVLPSGSSCPNNFGGVPLCHVSACGAFRPSLGERPFFSELLKIKEKQRDNVENNIGDREDIRVDMSAYDQEISSIRKIIQEIDREKMEQ